jgi:short-subunit dehydrogenase
MRFRERVALVTGAASGIGRALCRQLGREGAALGLVDRNAAALEPLQAELSAAGVRCASAVADVRSRDQIRRAVEEVTQPLGPADLLIPSAGICGLSHIEDLNIPLLEEIVQVNFLGVVYTLEAVLPSMLARGRGHVVGIASLAALRAIPFESAYCASKAALAAYLEGLRPTLRRRGIHLTTVYPGFVQTPLLENLLAASRSRAPASVMEPDAAALVILAAVHRRSRETSFPRTTGLMMRAARLMPAGLYDWVMTRIATRIPLPY